MEEIERPRAARHRGVGNYDSLFFDYVNSGAIASARCLVPQLLAHLEIRSVLDVGCGLGAWLSVWQSLGVEDVRGVDGDYVQRENLLIEQSAFVPANLAAGFRIARKFDLVQSLEVAEHLPESSAGPFVDSLVAHGELILFSAAPRGQGGDHHINEQDYDYWRQHFARRGYAVFDFVRPLVLHAQAIEPWYRFNTFLYASSGSSATLPEGIQRCRVPDNVRLQDLSPWTFRLRKTLLGMLPIPVITRLAKINQRRIVNRQRSRPHADDGR